jgi:TolA-binding protein
VIINNGLELAALITAIGGLIGLFLNGKRIDALEKELATQKKENSRLRVSFRHRIQILNKIIVSRESEINKLQMQQQIADERERRWQEHADRLGREYGIMQRQVLTLEHQIASMMPNEAPKKHTAPLPPIEGDP